MIPINIRGLSKVLSAVAVVAMLTGSAVAGQDSEPIYPPDGTWLAIGTAVISGASVKIPFMDTYASLLNQHGLKGTVICTMNWRNRAVRGRRNLQSKLHGTQRSWIST